MLESVKNGLAGQWFENRYNRGKWSLIATSAISGLVWALIANKRSPVKNDPIVLPPLALIKKLQKFAERNQNQFNKLPANTLRIFISDLQQLFDLLVKCKKNGVDIVAQNSLKQSKLCLLNFIDVGYIIGIAILNECNIREYFPEDEMNALKNFFRNNVQQVVDYMKQGDEALLSSMSCNVITMIAAEDKEDELAASMASSIEGNLSDSEDRNLRAKILLFTIIGMVCPTYLEGETREKFALYSSKIDLM